VDIALRTDLLPALPDSIRGIVQLVSGSTYTIQYETDDLLGVVAAVAPELVDTVSCVSELILAREYSDAKDALQDARTTMLEDALAALGVVPSDGSGQFVVHPSSAPGVSVECILHNKVVVPATVGSETVVVQPSQLAAALSLLSATGLKYRLEVSVTAISEKVTDNRDSAAEFLMVGAFDEGASYQTILLMENDGVTITGVKSGNNFHINITNPSSGAVTAFVTSKFRILS
jgi:hypothetical protein